MAYVVTENCIRCKYMDCVAVCPVDCFHEGDTMLVINPEVCIDCGVCTPECPVGAIRPDVDDGMRGWALFNAKYASVWRPISAKGVPPDDASAWDGAPEKLKAAFGASDPALA